MLRDFHCECGTHFLVRENPKRIRCPKCQRVLVVKEPPPQKAGKESRRAWLAGAGILLCLFALLVIYPLFRGAGEETLTGAWLLDQEAAKLPGAAAGDEIALDFQANGTWVGHIPGGAQAGSWKIVKKRGRKLTVELSSPGAFPDLVEINVLGKDRLALRFSENGGSYGLQRSRIVPPLNEPDIADRISARSEGPRSVAAGSRLNGAPSSSEDVNYSLIETGLYMGGSVPEPPPGTRAVINLCEKYDRYRREVSLWVPIADSAPAPAISWLQHWVKVIHGTRRKGLTTYVHCRAGVSRSGLLVTAYCMFEKRWTRDQALDFVRSKRPVTQPNPAFMQLLLDWEHFLQKS